MQSSLYIKSVKGKGRGVFSKEPIQKDSLIEECPLVVLPGEDYDTVISTRMANYCFFFDSDKEELAIVLGFGSLYNHAVRPNALHQLDRGKRVMLFYAIRNIAAGEEICISYEGGPGEDPLKWFNDRKLKFKP